MVVRSCRRCHRIEVIPPEQAVECSGEVLPLCRDCWTDFRSWFYEDEERRPDRLIDVTVAS